MESLLPVVSTFGILSTEDIEGTIIVFVAFMATALSIGGIAFSFKIADVATKTIYQKGMGMIRGAGRMVTTPVKGAAKIAGKGMVEDWRNDLASGYEPGGSKVKNLGARIASGAWVPGKRGELKVAARAQAKRNMMNDHASALLNQAGIDTGSDVAAALRNADGRAPGPSLRGLDISSPYITEQMADRAAKTGDSAALMLLAASPDTNKPALVRAFNNR